MNDVPKVNRNLCAVTEEKLVEMAQTNVDLYYTKGEMNKFRVLFALGFQIDFGDYKKGIRATDGVLVRNNIKPHLVYRTKVYSGQVRFKVDKVKDGVISYKKGEYHPLKKQYEKYEVLQPTDIYKYIPESSMESILDIGSMIHYNKGLTT